MPLGTRFSSVDTRFDHLLGVDPKVQFHLRYQSGAEQSLVAGALSAGVRSDLAGDAASAIVCIKGLAR